MIIPTKHEDLKNNMLVIGADILHELRNEDLSVEKIFQLVRKDHNVKVELILDTLVFLWAIEAISLNEGLLSSFLKEK